MSLLSLRVRHLTFSWLLLRTWLIWILASHVLCMTFCINCAAFGVMMMMMIMIDWLIDWLSKVWRPTKHIIGHIGDDFYKSYDQINSVKALMMIIMTMLMLMLPLLLLLITINTIPCNCWLIIVVKIQRRNRLHSFAGEKKLVHIGQRVILECHAVLHNRIVWRYTSPDDNNDIRIVYWRNNIYNVDRRRFSVSRPENDVFDLVIDNVTASDAGIYRCRENNGRYPGEACTEVIVNPAGQFSDFINA